MGYNKRLIITKIFSFDSAHSLINYNGKCSNVHGHTYTLEVSVSGYPDADGMVADFHYLDAIVRSEAVDILDHKNLNDVLDANPTCENIAVWIWRKLEAKLEQGCAAGNNGCRIEKIVLWETRSSSVTIERQLAGGSE